MTTPTAPADRAECPTTALELTTYPGVLLVAGDLPPHVGVLVREALAAGARLTIMTIQAPGSPATASGGDQLPLTATEVATHFRVEPATVRAWCREGRFPGAERLGKSWRIPAGAVHDRPPPAPRATAPSAEVPRPTIAPTDGTRAPQAPRRGRRAATKDRSAIDGFDRTALSTWRTVK